jgi:hypothetical protein
VRLGSNREAAANDFRSAVRKFAPFEPSASIFGPVDSQPGLARRELGGTWDDSAGIRR